MLVCHFHMGKYSCVKSVRRHPLNFNEHQNIYGCQGNNLRSLSIQSFQLPSQITNVPGSIAKNGNTCSASMPVVVLEEKDGRVCAADEELPSGMFVWSLSSVEVAPFLLSEISGVDDELTRLLQAVDSFLFTRIRFSKARTLSIWHDGLSCTDLSTQSNQTSTSSA